MLIDKAASAFRAARGRYTISRSLANHSGFVVMDEERTKYTDGMGVSRSDAEAIRDDLDIKAGITAALPEIVSVRVLTMALINCGAPIGSARALAANLVPAIVELAAADESALTTRETVQ